MQPMLADGCVAADAVGVEGDDARSEALLVCSEMLHPHCWRPGSLLHDCMLLRCSSSILDSQLDSSRSRGVGALIPLLLYFWIAGARP